MPLNANDLGKFSKSLISNLPIDKLSETYNIYKNKIITFPEEAVYIYSFKENRMVYAQGWKEVLGYDDDEINMLQIVEITTPEYAPFASEINDKAMLFLLQKTESLEAYSFTIEIKKYHKNGKEIPLIVKVGVHKAENGKVVEIIGRNQINKSLRLGKIMRFSAYGPEKVEFEDELSKDLFTPFVISAKEKEAIALIANGLSFKEVANELGVSQSAIEKRILPLYKRFEVKSLTHLISFAHENQILP
jgi:DNA-binding CsgD family transcriptional regulator